MSLLEYEHQIILDAFHDDGLLVMARGLGVERIFSNFLKVYCDPKNLVLVLNTTQLEEEYFIEQLDSEEIRPLPKQVTADLNVNDRRSVYMEGGVLFVTSRILVVDLLTDRLPTDLVTGILVYKAHKVIDSCQEAFILRLFRQKNKTGFVKAFSDSPQSFTAGFCQVEKVMKSLFIRKLFLWPRFHASVSSCFDAHQVEVVELHLHLTQSMTACQTALLDLIDACIKEVKRSNPSLDTDEITVETSLTRNFDKIIRLQLDPVWHQLGPRTRQLVADIKTLRLMLQYLPQYDCVNFYNLVNSVRTNEKEFGKNSGWMFMDAADSLFAHAKLRLFGEIKKAKKSKTDEKKDSSDKEVPEGPQVLEECPKWNVLREVLDEIEADSKEADPSLGPSRVLVAAQDDRTCSQIREFLSDGSQVMLQRLYNKTIGFKTGARLRGEQSNSRQAKGNKTDKHEKNWTLTQMIKENEKSDTDKMEADVQGTPPEDSMYKVLDCPFTVIYPLHGSQDPHSLTRVLHKLEPRYVVLYDADMAFVRQLELFRATRPGKPLRVYFMMYAGSTEEQRYLTTLRKEKEAFEYLIRQKATMVIPEEREGRLENDPNLTRDTTPANATVSTRKGGQQATNVQQKIIVDMREFRSELPSLIHKRGIEIEPVTIDVGDYILTPDICVERKSVSDLIGSLNNGRLYNQATSMCRYYKRPILLIEFDTNKPFSLQGKSFMSSEINSSDVTSRLTLLTLHFPRLRILWCQSPHATAELFHELKMGRAQPEAAAAMSVGGEEGSEVESAKYSHEPKALLLKMPGINTKNVHAIMNRVKDLSELVTLTEEQLTQTLESQPHARLLWTFIHSRHDPTQIIVDMREFRSELPSLIHKRGIEIEPVTIDVGDYILTPDICVERKSVSDLIGSLNNGRLYNQATSMCRYYKRPILLIEFDTNKPFSLQGKSFMSSEINSSDVTSRLTLLTLHFPRLRILWCQSPHATAELFHELKMGRAQPEAAAAMSVGGEEGSEVESAKYSHEPKALLLKMPGINTKNVHAIMNRVKDLSELVTLTEEQLTQTLESQPHARLLWTFIHSRHDPTQVSTSATGGEGRGKGMPRGGATGKRPSATNMATGGKWRK